MEYIVLPDRYKKREDRRQMYLQTSRNCDPYLANSGTLQELIDQSSGSGSGLPLLVSTETYTYFLFIYYYYYYFIYIYIYIYIYNEPV